MPEQAADELIGLTIRQKSAPAPADRSRVYINNNTAMRRQDADREFGTAQVGRPTVGAVAKTGVATVQLFDLAEAGIASAKPGKSLRVLAKLSCNGGTIKLGSDATILDGDRFAYRYATNGQKWINGELFLMSFSVEGDGKVTQYDVLLELTKSSTAK